MKLNTATSMLVTGASLVLAVSAIVVITNSTVSADSRATPAAEAGLVRRGEYLVHGVGLCIDCHSPRGADGAFIEDRHLTGSAIPFAPTVPMPAWATAAPSIVGLPLGWDEAAMVRFLTTGERPNNMPSARPPMPPYRMNREDAEAVTAYVRTLGAAAPR